MSEDEHSLNGNGNQITPYNNSMQQIEYNRRNDSIFMSGQIERMNENLMNPVEEELSLRDHEEAILVCEMQDEILTHTGEVLNHKKRINEIQLAYHRRKLQKDHEYSPYNNNKLLTNQRTEKMSITIDTYGDIINKLIYDVSLSFSNKWQTLNQDNFGKIKNSLLLEPDSTTLISDSGNLIHNGYLLFCKVIDYYKINSKVVDSYDNDNIKISQVILGNQSKGSKKANDEDILFISTGIREENLIDKENSLITNLRNLFYFFSENYAYYLLYQTGYGVDVELDGDFSEIDESSDKQEDKTTLKNRKNNLKKLKGHMTSLTMLFETNPVYCDEENLMITNNSKKRRTNFEQILRQRYSGKKRISSNFLRQIYQWASMWTCYEQNILKDHIIDNEFIFQKRPFPYIQNNANKGKKQNTKLPIHTILNYIFKLQEIDLDKEWGDNDSESIYNHIGLDLEKLEINNKKPKKAAKRKRSQAIVDDEEDEENELGTCYPYLQNPSTYNEKSYRNTEDGEDEMFESDSNST